MRVDRAEMELIRNIARQTASNVFTEQIGNVYAKLKQLEESISKLKVQEKPDYETAIQPAYEIREADDTVPARRGRKPKYTTS